MNLFQLEWIICLMKLYSLSGYYKSWEMKKLLAKSKFKNEYKNFVCCDSVTSQWTYAKIREIWSIPVRYNLSIDQGCSRNEVFQNLNFFASAHEGILLDYLFIDIYGWHPANSSAILWQAKESMPKSAKYGRYLFATIWAWIKDLQGTMFFRI